MLVQAGAFGEHVFTEAKLGNAPDAEQQNMAVNGKYLQVRPDLEFERRAPSLGNLDGGDGLGHVVTYHACTRAMALAEESGSGVVAAKNSSHFGMAGFYVKRIVSAGYIGIMMTSPRLLII